MSHNALPFGSTAHFGLWVTLLVSLWIKIWVKRANVNITNNRLDLLSDNTLRVYAEKFVARRKVRSVIVITVTRPAASGFLTIRPQLYQYNMIQHNTIEHYYCNAVLFNMWNRECSWWY